MIQLCGPVPSSDVLVTFTLTRALEKGDIPTAKFKENVRAFAKRFGFGDPEFVWEDNIARVDVFKDNAAEAMRFLHVYDLHRPDPKAW